MGVFELGFAGDGFAVGHLRGTGLHVHLVFTAHTFDVHVQVKFAHTLDDGFAGFLVHFHLESGVFLGEAVQSLGHVVQVVAVLGFNHEFDHGVRHVHRSHVVVVLAVGKGRTGGAVDTEQGNDIACTGFGDIHHFVGVHTHETAHGHLLTGGHVGNHVALLKGALVHADVGELAVAVVHQLERVADERSVVFGLQDNFGFVVVQVESLVFHVGRAGEVVDNAIEELLNADVLVGRTHEHGSDVQTDGGFTDGLLDEGLVDFIYTVLAFHGLFHNFVAVVSAAVDELGAVFVGLVHQFGRDFLFDHVVAVGAFEVVGLHFHQVNHALQLVFETDRNLHHAGLVVELFLEHHGHAERVCTGAVALVDEHDARHMVALHLAVNSNRLGLDAFHAGKNEDSTVEHAERTFHFDSEVHVPRGIDDVDGVLFTALGVGPVSECSGGLNRDAAFAFKFHGVHRGADAVFTTNFVDSVDTLCEVEDTFGKGSLTGVDVGRNTNISVLFNVFHILVH